MLLCNDAFELLCSLHDTGVARDVSLPSRPLEWGEWTWLENELASECGGAVEPGLPSAPASNSGAPVGRTAQLGSLESRERRDHSLFVLYHSLHRQPAKPFATLASRPQSINPPAAPSRPTLPARSSLSGRSVAQSAHSLALLSGTLLAFPSHHDALAEDAPATLAQATTRTTATTCSDSVKLKPAPH